MVARRKVEDGFRLGGMARGELATIHAEEPPQLPPLLDFVPQISPKFRRPEHLAPVVGPLEAVARGEPQFLLGSAPPRHGKTELLLHWAAWLLKQHPDWIIGYATYQANLALAKSRRAMQFALAAGVELATTKLDTWLTTSGGGFLARGIDGAFTGFGVNVLIIDDPHKNRAQAESTTYRNKVWESFRNDLFTRIEPGGSCIINMTRWHPDDLVGRVKAELGEDADWYERNLPALRDGPAGPETEALWPQQWPLELLLKRRKTLGDYAWNSLFMGRPRGRGKKVFGDPQLYTELPRTYRVGQGLDLAYTKKTSSDHSVVVTFLEHQGKIYLARVVREQMDAPSFKVVARNERKRYPSARMRMYASGVEQGALSFFTHGTKESPGITNLEILPAQADKFVRSIPYAATWNRGDVLVPADYDRDTPEGEAIEAFVTEHAAFTGVNDPEDDTIDAGAAAHDVVLSGEADFDELDKHRPRNTRDLGSSAQDD